jgi:suppressor for copper-sensitivity B
VLNRGEVFQLLSGGQVIAMQGDWTRPDPKITTYLKSFGRFGIPFNAIYGPGKVDGLTLPELLTSGLVMDGLAKASANALATAAK